MRISRSEFDRLWPLLDASLASFGRTHTKDQVWERIYKANATLWPGDESVIVTELIKHPIGITSCNVWLQGGKLEELTAMHLPLEAWAARECGAHRLIAWGRDGWLRALDGWHSCGTRRAKWLCEVPQYLKATKA